MEIFILDIEGTNQDITLNKKSEIEGQNSSDQLNETLGLIDLGMETSLCNINGTYITSKNNAADLNFMYGWHFSQLVITEM